MTSSSSFSLLSHDHHIIFLHDVDDDEQEECMPCSQTPYKARGERLPDNDTKFLESDVNDGKKCHRLVQRLTLLIWMSIALTILIIISYLIYWNDQSVLFHNEQVVYSFPTTNTHSHSQPQQGWMISCLFLMKHYQKNIYPSTAKLEKVTQKQNQTRDHPIILSLPVQQQYHENIEDERNGWSEEDDDMHRDPIQLFGQEDDWHELKEGITSLQQQYNDDTVTSSSTADQMRLLADDDIIPSQVIADQSLFSDKMANTIPYYWLDDDYHYYVDAKYDETIDDTERSIHKYNYPTIDDDDNYLFDTNENGMVNETEIFSDDDKASYLLSNFEHYMDDDMADDKSLLLASSDKSSTLSSGTWTDDNYNASLVSLASDDPSTTSSSDNADNGNDKNKTKMDDTAMMIMMDSDDDWLEDVLYENAIISQALN